MLKYIDTPILEIKEDLFKASGVNVFVKHEGLNHQSVAGNKFWKLKYNLQQARNLNHTTLLTFGGAYSNHIYSTAGAAKELGFRSIGIIRGEEVLPLNSTLAFAKACGMVLSYVSREAYRKKNEEEFIQELRQTWGNFYLIPEGGTNALALKGCMEFAKQKLLPFDFDYLCLPVGTGGTIAGIISGLEAKRNVIGFPVLKGGDFLKDEIKKLVKEYSGQEYHNWSLQADYHFGGYAKGTEELDLFITRMQQLHKLRLDHVYTGKLMAGVYDLISKKYFERRSRILIVHTGGLR